MWIVSNNNNKKVKHLAHDRCSIKDSCYYQTSVERCRVCIVVNQG